MKSVHSCAPLCAFWLLVGCASQRDRPASAATAEESASAVEIANDMATAMAADPEAVAPGTAALARLMATAIGDASERSADEAGAASDAHCPTAQDPVRTC